MSYDLKRADYQDFCNEFVDKHLAMTVNAADLSLRPYTVINYDPIRDAASDVLEEAMEKIPLNALGDFLRRYNISLNPIEKALETVAERVYGQRYDH